jgi:hypothetical protein
MLRTREHAPTFYFYVVFILDSHLSLLRRLGVRHPQMYAMCPMLDKSSQAPWSLRNLFTVEQHFCINQFPLELPKGGMNLEEKAQDFMSPGI